MSFYPNSSKRPLVNIPMVMRVIGWLLIIEGGFMLAPLIMSLVTEDGMQTTFLWTVAFTFAMGLVFTFLIPKPKYDMGKRDGFLLTALVWITFSCCGMLPFMDEPVGMGFTDAFFETMSGFTTTGASLIPEDKTYPDSLVLWRCMMEWIGGMGIIIFTLAVLPMLNFSGGVQMFNAEVTGITHDKLRPRVSQTAKGLWGVYLLLTVSLFLLMWAGPLDCFESVCQAFSIMSTGGFVPPQMSPSTWDSVYMTVVAVVFMFLGGMNFGLIFGLLNGRWREPWRNDVFKVYLCMVASVWVLFAAYLMMTRGFIDWEHSLLHPLFMVVSMMSSTGYVTGDFQQWGPFIDAVALVLMFFGASAGSTSGGAKIDRLVYMFKYMRNQFYRILHPNYIMGVRMNGVVVSQELIHKVMTFLTFWCLIVVGGGIVLSATGIPLYESFYASFTCMSNTGILPGTASVSFDQIPGVGKWVLSLLMLTGRLEIFTVIVLFSRSFWRR